MRRLTRAVPLVVLTLLIATPAHAQDEAPRLPARAVAIVQALYGQRQDLARGTDDQRRQLTRMICEQLRWELGPAWGHKSADPTRPPSKDAIAYRSPAGLLWGWDWQSGSSREPMVVEGQEAESILGQHFLDVSPGQNHLSAPAQPPAPACAAERARIAELEADIYALHTGLGQMGQERDEARAELEALKARPAPTCRAKLWGFIPVPCKVTP